MSKVDICTKHGKSHSYYAHEPPFISECIGDGGAVIRSQKSCQMTTRFLRKFLFFVETKILFLRGSQTISIHFFPSVYLGNWVEFSLDLMYLLCFAVMSVPLSLYFLLTISSALSPLDPHVQVVMLLTFVSKLGPVTWPLPPLAGCPLAISTPYCCS